MSSFLRYMSQKYRQHTNVSHGNERGSEAKITQESEALTLVSDNEYALSQVSCRVCKIYDREELYLEGVRVANLSENCQFCKYLRKCHQHFGKSSVYIGRWYQGSKTNIQLCFRKDGTGCDKIHVQLYSTGLSFFYLLRNRGLSDTISSIEYSCDPFSMRERHLRECRVRSLDCSYEAVDQSLRHEPSACSTKTQLQAYTSDQAERESTEYC